MFDFGFAKMFSTAISDTYFYHKDVWIAAADYYIYINLIVLSLNQQKKRVVSNLFMKIT